MVASDSRMFVWWAKCGRNALRRAIEDVKQKALTQCLRRLQASGFILRSVVSTAPVAIEISPLLRDLEAHPRAILEWSEDHPADVMEAQKAFAVRKTDEADQLANGCGTDCGIYSNSASDRGYG